MTGRVCFLRGPGAVALAALLLLESTPARAEGTSATAATPAPAESPDTAEARQAFRLGSALAREGQWLDALASFRRSATLKPHPVTTYNVAYCERALGHYARAVDRFTAALQAVAGTEPLPEELARDARAYVAEASRRVARLAVSVTEPDLALTVDGLPLTPMAARPAVLLLAADDRPVAKLGGAFELWLDPGAHVFVVTHADGRRSVESRTYPEGAAVAVSLPFEGAPRPPVVAANEPARRPPNRVPAYVALGVGAAGLVVSGVFAGLTLGERSTLKGDPRCAGTTCPDEPSYVDREQRMRTFADVATVGLVVAAVGAATGITLWLTASPGESASAAGPLALHATVGPGSASVGGRF